MVTVDQILERLDSWIVDRSKTVIVVFGVLTLLLTPGMGMVSMDSGTQQFIEDVPAQVAYENIQEEFESGAFEPDSGSSQVIHKSSNVLAKPELQRMLTLQERAHSRPDIRVSDSSSAAEIVALQLDPTARTLDQKQAAIEDATATEIDNAVKRAAETPGFTALLSNDFNRESASASATIATVSHEVPTGLSDSAGTTGTTPMSEIQSSLQHVAQSTQGDFTVFGMGIVSSELSNVIGDSLAIVVPAAGILILVFLAIAYRDPVDFLLGIISLVMAVVWTFGFMGWAGIPFGQMTIAVPVLLLAVGIDFGIHVINRYREERAEGKGIEESMRPTTDQLLIAFFIVTGTTVIGFSANLLSKLGPIREFGGVASIGIIFSFLIFGIFLPAMKVYLDNWREKISFPEFGSKPIGSGDSKFGQLLGMGNYFASRAPLAFLVVILVTGVAAGAYGTGVDTSFSQEDFLPPEDIPDALQQLPGPFAPGTYTTTETINFLEDNFESADSDSVTLYVDGQMRQDDSLEQIHKASKDPPPSFVSEDRAAQPESIISVIQSYARQNPEFARLVQRNDRNSNGVPDDNLGDIYAQLLDSPVRQQALTYISDDFREAQVIYQTETDYTDDEVTADGQEVAGRMRLHTIATGETVIFAAITDILLESALISMAGAILVSSLFLIFIYWVLEDKPWLGLVNVAPIVITLTWLAGSMRLLGLPFNALTATILSIAIGLGIDYSAHLVHRFADEYEENEHIEDALEETVRGTGGALAGSMLTTSSGTAVLALAITPVLGQFGLLMALVVFFSFVSSLLITPSAAVIWAEWAPDA